MLISKNFCSKFVNELNLLSTSIVIIFSLYVAFVAILGQSFFSPTSTTAIHSISKKSTNETSFGIENNDDGQQYGANFLSIFILWVLALFAGRIFHYCQLPPLLGMLLIGMVFANIKTLNSFLSMRQSWTSLCRNIAFVLILLRCGVGLNPDVLHRSLLFCSAIGILTSLAEIMAIFIVSYFIFLVPLSAAILFSFVLASTSPAVTVPTMINLQQQQFGTNKGIPTMALAGASIDNIFCISGFAIAYAIASPTNPDNFKYTILSILIQLIAAVFFGFFLGYLLRYLPHPNVGKSIHFARVLLLCSLSMALYFGPRAIHYDVFGPISIILMCFLAASGWKLDNPKGTHLEAEALRHLWNLLLLPLLFVLIGLLFDFSIFTWQMLVKSISAILIGILIRILLTFAIARVNPILNLKEAIFFSTVFLPKATVQAALAPQLFVFSLAVNDQDSAQFTLQTSILSILLTAPIGQLLIQQLGKRFLLNEQKLDGGNEKPSTGIEKRKSVISPVIFEDERRKEEEIANEGDIFAEETQSIDEKEERPNHSMKNIENNEKQSTV